MSKGDKICEKAVPTDCVNRPFHELNTSSNFFISLFFCFSIFLFSILEILLTVCLITHKK